MATNSLSYPLVSSPDPSTASSASTAQMSTSPTSGYAMQSSLSSGSTSSTGTQPTLHKARSRHFDMFQQSATFSNDSQPPLFIQQSQQSYINHMGYGFVDQSEQGFPQDSITDYRALNRMSANFQHFAQTNWNVNSAASMPYARIIEHSPPLDSNEIASSFIASPVTAGPYSPPASLSPTKSETLSMFISPVLPPLPTSADLIPNAIVIKSIPFAVTSDEFLDIVLSAGVPRPYAFNYHIDDRGKFRGLAFANFSTVDDARLALAVLNGYEVYGRKLRAEYKKMLPREERERIERDKRMRRGQLEEQHRQQEQQYNPGPVQTEALNFNSQAVIDLYSELLLFKNRDAEEIALGPFTAENKRVVQQIAEKLGLFSNILLDGTAIVSKHAQFQMQQQQQQQQQQRRLLYRQSFSNLSAAAASATNAATEPGLSRRSVHAPLPINATGTASALLDYKSASNQHRNSSSARTLRGTKSFADIRSTARNSFYSQANSSSGSVNSFPHRSSMNNLNGNNGIPAVPDIASALANQLKSGPGSGDLHHPIRQPLAPDSSGGYMGLQNSVLRE
ncbi:hypothetical protein V1512DRAFT_275834 [Lipomyces arxii]|uniref:uncharacterized protein n=1 Tax=Lipomyces arxii TaxID=56418 RepID=UPI0034CF8161